MVISSAAQRGADVIAQTLTSLGVEVVFCYPGGANLEILDAISRVQIELIRTEHEQGAVFAAQGYARASGRLGVCLATSGPGATNLVTGIADANSDSIPVLAITGNVATRWLGRNAFQEVDIVAIVRPITKFCVQVAEPDKIAATLTAAAHMALAGRPGPVLVDFPKDIQQAHIMSPSTEDGATAMAAKSDALSALGLERIAQLLAHSRRPVIYAGGGIIASGMHRELAQLAQRLNCPVTLTLMGLGAFDAQDPLFLGPLGMHGAYCANVAVNEADLVLALGVRFDDRVIGDPAAFAADAAILHIDIDPAELGKNKQVAVAVAADLREALPALLSIAAPIATAEWLDYLRAIACERPLHARACEAGGLNGPHAIAMLAERLPKDAIVTTGVGQHQMWAMQFARCRSPRRFLSSAGFGTMGFGLPAAIGAKRAHRSATVVDIDGDGSLNMTINELSTCKRYRLGVKIFVVNNQWLGMVRQWQDMIYRRNRVASNLRDPWSDTACEAADSRPYPDFLAIAAGYAIAASRVRTPEELRADIERMLSDPDEPYVLDVIVRRESDVLPMIPSGKSYRDVLFESQARKVDDT